MAGAGGILPELGRFLLTLAFALALLQFVLPLAGLRGQRVALLQSARPTALAQALCVWAAFAVLAICFANNDFSVAYVASNSNTHLPFAYRLAAVWSAHEGSLLLWVSILCLWTVAVCLLSHRLPRDVAATIIAILGGISVGFLAFMLFTSDPFARAFPVPLQGRDLNPLLQDPGLVIHPPMLYMGYVGFSVAFAFALSALISGRLDSAWARWTRPWTTAAWVFLTCGITLGSWWSYRELGWGGWWFWDPVENASFMPWLVGTALIHSLASTEKRGLFRSWTVLLAITAFSLCLIGTFLVRSGVLISVHAFATDPLRGLFILYFLAIVIGSSLLLYAIRAPRLGASPSAALFSREGLLLFNNAFLTTAAAAVFIGTLYPLFADAMGLGKISVGPPYFNAVFVPIMLPLVVLASIVGVVRWRQGNWQQAWQRLRWPLLLVVPLGLALPWLLFGQVKPGAMAAAAMGLWLMVAATLEPWQWWKQRRWRLPRSVAGMACAHFGLGVAVLAICFTSVFSSERAVHLNPGEQATLAGYSVRLGQTTEHAGPNFDALIAELEVSRNGQVVGHLQPAKRYYRASGQVMTEAGVLRSASRDLYVALGEHSETDGQVAWSLRLYYRPFVLWIWLGALLMAVGGLLAISDRRYRLPKTEAA